MRNKHAAPCCQCDQHVPAGEGFFQKRLGTGWNVRCMRCVVAGKVERGNPLSLAQQAFLDQGRDLI